MRVCQSIQELLDEELSQMWEGLDYEGLNVEATKEWFAGTDIFIQILDKLKEENKHLS
jgi:hypothetical protein